MAISTSSNIKEMAGCKPSSFVAALGPDLQRNPLRREKCSRRRSPSFCCRSRRAEMPFFFRFLSTRVKFLMTSTQNRRGATNFARRSHVPFPYFSLGSPGSAS